MDLPTCSGLSTAKDYENDRLVAGIQLLQGEEMMS